MCIDSQGDSQAGLAVAAAFRLSFWLLLFLFRLPDLSFLICLKQVRSGPSIRLAVLNVPAAGVPN